LGYIIAIANDAGTVIEEQNFDPWGRRRNINNWGYDNAQSIVLIDRGYTCHEHLNEFGIINMNGRLYDPVLGRMLSPDNYVQAPDFTQNFNRYSYAWNNPLAFTDPDGDFVVAAFLIGMAVSAVIDYGIQVGMNYVQGYRGKDAWFNKVDFFDVAISAGIGGLTADWGGYLFYRKKCWKICHFLDQSPKINFFR
jgi:RHS repeat-associated protein